MMFDIRRGAVLAILLCFPLPSFADEGPTRPRSPNRDQNQARSRQPANRSAAANALEPTHADVAYGPHERNRLDFYQAESEQPTPLIVYIHGGGFVGGDKRSLSPAMVREANRAGISVAALNYRFVDGETVIFPTPQMDSARALQFLRSKAEEWKIDPGRVACYGGSAGAGISMWLGFHEDLADPDSEDPIARQSTRITAIGTMGGQGTYDPIKIKELVGGRAWEHPSIFKVHGVKTAEEALNPSEETQKLYDEGSAITHLTEDDPPLFMIYSEPDVVPPADSRPGQFIHHPNFGKQLKKEMDALGIENHYAHTAEAKGRNLQKEMLEFFKKQFAEAE
ncbi:alpha/beta hydrolase family protein [Candidatus Laterigemmans baculatus]|uniref:alpha/beta hydrolase family protein n=1 Tax=Candidatus Laterigemmans baculatus TaxID=2770505 RepID=UPI0013DB01C6|nr:alpha/beta hydrolase [Candidatus Laterigemmans baculatus]